MANKNAKTLSTEPYKGTIDWYPEEFQVRKYIFDTWRRICTSYGYEEYLTPIVESADIYRAKSGEDLGGKELMVLEDRAGRELAIRPEMTPSVTRMVSKIYGGRPKPIRYFSIANFMRGEKPQRGRNREFWQLNYDVFGSESINADIEILQIALDIVLSFNPPEESFTLFINNRKLIDAILDKYAKINEDQRTEVVRTLDKWEKLSKEDFVERLSSIGLNSKQVEQLELFMKSKTELELRENIPGIETEEGYREINQILAILEQLGYSKWVKFQPNVIRGFDYYDGMVFEMFDNHPDNLRAMYGGGRYNGLANLFGAESFPATGCAPGDEPLRLFLESWGLLDEIIKKSKVSSIYIPILEESAYSTSLKLAQTLRAQGKNVEVGLQLQNFNKALKYGQKREFDFVVLIGTDELSAGEYRLKDMLSGIERVIKL